jgi:uncharacterized OB-fold protein
MSSPGVPPEAFVADFTLAYTYKRSTGPVLGRFLGALSEGIILGATAANGEVIVPASEYDPRTGAATTGLVPVGPTGTITSWSWVDAPGPNAPSATPFAWALILLTGATTPMLHIVRGDPAAIQTGATVRAVFAEQPTGSITDLSFEVVP